MTGVISGLARSILKEVVAGGAAIGTLLGVAFPLLPVLLSLFLIGLGLLLRVRRFRVAV
jgi:hypothetical protein